MTGTSIPRHRNRRRYPQFYRINVPFFSQFTINIPTSFNNCNLIHVIQTLGDIALYLLGPVLIIVVFALLIGLSYTFFMVIMPMRSPDGYFTYHALKHELFVIFILCNVLFNYILCVMTSNTNHTAKYNLVVRELAKVTNFDYPKDESENECWRNTFRL